MGGSRLVMKKARQVHSNNRFADEVGDSLPNPIAPTPRLRLNFRPMRIGDLVLPRGVSVREEEKAALEKTSIGPSAISCLLLGLEPVEFFSESERASELGSL